jgi:CRISPR-associated protein Csb2
VFTIQVEYLMGRVYAADFRDGTAPEWPPHPSRLFSALVAALHDNSGDESERGALEWLSAQGAPSIAAARSAQGNAVVTFVPTNYAGKSGSTHPDQRGKQPRSFPAQSPESPIVHFIWPQAQPTESFRTSLDQLTARVASLGRACSLVRVTLADNHREPNYLPDDSGKHVFRIFGEGRLEELETLYNMDQRPNVSPQKRYIDLQDVPKAEPVPGCFGEMIVFRRVEGIGLPCEAVLTLTEAFRNAILALASDQGNIVEMLSGHGEHPHCAFAALPFVEYEHASGKLMGVAMILPRNMDSSVRRHVLRACAALERINLREVLGEWKVEIANFDVPQRSLRPATWIGPSRVWNTATPIVLDRFPKKNLTVDDILQTACERVGLPRPVGIEHSPFSQLEGVPPVPEFRLLRKASDRAKWGVHATLTFDQPVRGPLLIGSGRYFGLGLLKPDMGTRYGS